MLNKQIIVANELWPDLSLFLFIPKGYSGPVDRINRSKKKSCVGVGAWCVHSRTLKFICDL